MLRTLEELREYPLGSLDGGIRHDNALDPNGANRLLPISMTNKRVGGDPGVDFESPGRDGHPMDLSGCPRRNGFLAPSKKPVAERSHA